MSNHPSGYHSTPSKPPGRVIVVVGMHRSGTSALAGILHHLGAALPKHLLPSNKRNPRGYFESSVFYRLHNELLADAGSAWNRVKGPTREWFASRSSQRWVERLAEAAQNEFEDTELLVFKDPRLCRMLPIWNQVFARLGVKPHYLIPVRNPIDSARSLRKASDVPESLGSMLWLDHFLCAERDTRDSPRAFIRFENLLRNWKTEVTRACAQAEVHFPPAGRLAEARIEAFLEPRSGGFSTEESRLGPDVHPWIEEAYELALEACATAHWNPEPLDEIRSAFQAAEAAFGPASASIENRLHKEVERRREVETTNTHLERELASQRSHNDELRNRLTDRRKEAQALGKTTELLMQWVLDKTREPDRPAAEELRASLSAIEKAEPAAIPQIASTALLLAEKNKQIAAHERERASRSAVIVDASRKVAETERALRRATETNARQSDEIQQLVHEATQSRERLAELESQVRIERAAAAMAAAEQARLSEELTARLQTSIESRLDQLFRNIGR